MRVLAWLTTIASLAFLSCESSPAGLLPGETLRHVPFPSTIELGPEDARLLGPMSADGRFTVSGATGQLSGLAAKKVLVAGASSVHPRGVLRMVRSVSVTDGGTLVETVPVPPQVAFRTLEVKLKRKVDDYGSPVNTWERDAGVVRAPLEARAQQAVDAVIFDGDGKAATTDDQIRLAASLGGGFTYELGISLDWGAIEELPGAVADCFLSALTSCGELVPELKAGFELSSDARADIALSGAAYQSFEKTVPLASVVVNPPVIAIGLFVFVVDVQVAATVSGSASSRFDVSTTAGYQVGTKLVFSSKTGAEYAPPSETHEFSVKSTSVGLSAKIRGEVSAQLTLLLYDVLGPRASLGIYTQLEASRTNGSSCFTVTGGPTASLGLVLGLAIPGYGSVDFGETSTTFDLPALELAKGACTVPPGGSTLGPGEGPDFERLANPTFTPVSRAHRGLIRFHPPASDSLDESRLYRAVDGRLMSTGSSHEALVKLDETGAVVWARALADVTRSSPRELTELTPLALAPTADARMLVLTEPPGWLVVDQDGTVGAGRRLGVPAAGRFIGPNGSTEVSRRLVDVIPDGAGGHWVTGASVKPGAADDQGPVRAVVYRVEPGGAVRWARAYEVQLPGRHLYPVRLDRLGGALSVVALDYDSVGLRRRVVHLRLAEGDGAVLSAKELRCAEDPADSSQPTTTLVQRNGNLLIGGITGAYEKALLLAVSPAGEPVWGARPWSGTDLSNIAPRSLAELPTSGLVLSGGGWFGFEARSMVAAGLDSVGTFRWLTTYALPSDPGNGSGTGRGSVLLTDDGGLFLVGTSNAPTDTSGGSLWAVKAFAKDGAITFTSAAVRTPRSFATAACTPVATPVVVAGSAVTTTQTPMVLEVRPAPGVSSVLVTP